MTRPLVAGLAALVLAGAGGAASSVPALAQDSAQRLAALNQQLAEEQSRLEALNDQVQEAQADLDRLNRLLEEDRQRQAQLAEQTTELARAVYQRPSGDLSAILDAGSFDRAAADAAESRLVSAREQQLLAQAEQLRTQDQQARDEQSARLADITSARDQVAQLAERTLDLFNSLTDAALRARAQALAAQAQATQAAAVQPQFLGSSQETPVADHFPAGYCTWYVASRRPVPWYGDAIAWWDSARAYGYLEGQIPAVGAIMVTRESVVYGHVAYVEAVNRDGSWTVSEMNFVGWNVKSGRTIRPGQVPLVGFIYGKA
jgi:surface antigen